MGHKPVLKPWAKVLILLFLLVVLSIIALPPIGPGIQKARENAAMQSSGQIALAMFQFSIDHDGKYPIGASSTKVFQQLLDGNYVSDPALFYVQMSGKGKPGSKKLKPENISFDVTIPVDSHSPQDLPLVFLTGYRINYQPDGSAVPLPSAAHPFHGLAACYHSNSAAFLGPNPAGSSQDIEHFIALDFDPRGKGFSSSRPTARCLPQQMGADPSTSLRMTARGKFMPDQMSCRFHCTSREGSTLSTTSS